MEDEPDRFPWKPKKKKQESESDDEKYGLGSKYRPGNSNTPNDQRINDSNGTTGTNLMYVQDKKPDPGIFPHYYYKDPIRGSAIFVVNQRFQEFSYREGAEADLSSLKSVFLHQLGFEQLNKLNDFDLTKPKLDDDLEQAIAKDYSDTDLFLFAISTHGEERPRYYDHFEHALICADDQYKFTSDIINKFGTCQTLAGKPKIFVIQACRSPSGSKENDPKIVDNGHEYKLVYKKEEKGSNREGNDSADANHKADAYSKIDIEDEANAKNQADIKTGSNDETYTEADARDKVNAKKNTDAKANTKDEADTRHKSNDYLKGQSDLGFESKTVISLINLHKDCLVVYAIQSGKVAWRHPKTGSWMLDALKEVLKQYTYPCRIPFLDILTKTAFKMAQRKSSEGGFKAVPVIHHRLTKDILIPLKQRQTYV